MPFLTTTSKGKARLKEYEVNPVGLALSDVVTDPSQLFLVGEQGFWIDPSDLSTMFQDTAGTTPVTATGQSVARINDKSGNGHVFTQSTAANRPTYNVDSRGYAYLNFDGSNDRLIATANVAMSASDKLCGCVGVDIQSVTTGKVIIYGGYGTAGGYACYGCLGNAGADFGGPGWPATGSTANGYKSVGARALGRSVVSAYIDISQASAELEFVMHLNGRPALGQIGGSTLGSGNFSDQVVHIGASNTGTLPFQGKIYGAVVRGGVITDAQQTGLDNWMNSKIGVW